MYYVSDEIMLAYVKINNHRNTYTVRKFMKYTENNTLKLKSNDSYPVTYLVKHKLVKSG